MGEWILNKQDADEWTRLIWLRKGRGGGFHRMQGIS